MQAGKRKKLEAAGWKVGTAVDFLGLSQSEATYIGMKLALGQSLKQRRLKHNLSQIALAKLLSSSQSRVAKMEAGDPSVSVDLLLKSLLMLGATHKDVARMISSVR